MSLFQRLFRWPIALLASFALPAVPLWAQYAPADNAAPATQPADDNEYMRHSSPRATAARSKLPSSITPTTTASPSISSPRSTSPTRRITTSSIRPSKATTRFSMK